MEKFKLKIFFSILVCLLFPNTFVFSQNQSVYDKVKEKGIVSVGLMTQSVPTAFINEKNEWVGFEVDLADAVINEIAKQMKRQLKIQKVKVNNKNRMSYLKTGRLSTAMTMSTSLIDISISNKTLTKEAKKYYDFSLVYFVDGQKILAKKGKYKKLKDFLNKRIAVVKYTTSEKNIYNFLKKNGENNVNDYVIKYKNSKRCFEALQKEKVDAWTGDSIILNGYAAKYPCKYELVGKFISTEPYAMGVPKSNEKWKKAVNSALSAIKKNGIYKKIYDKWFGKDSIFSFNK